jgi:hypothetical protein
MNAMSNNSEPSGSHEQWARFRFSVVLAFGQFRQLLLRQRRTRLIRRRSTRLDRHCRRNRILGAGRFNFRWRGRWNFWRSLLCIAGHPSNARLHGRISSLIRFCLYKRPESIKSRARPMPSAVGGLFRIVDMQSSYCRCSSAESLKSRTIPLSWPLGSTLFSSMISAVICSKKVGHAPL